MASIVATIVRIAVIPSESMMPALIQDEAVANSKIGCATKTTSTVVDGSSTISVVSTKEKQFIKRFVGVLEDNVVVYESNPYVALCNKNNNECKFRVDRTSEKKPLPWYHSHHQPHPSIGFYQWN
eukprot:CCRYP_000929-RA/>CCRYP_000929-RA protein AED:0.37 eAED:0.37 QI:0/0/0/0.5/1/1/2/0/124